MLSAQGLRKSYGGVLAVGGLHFTAAFEAAMRTWMAENPSNRYGRFEYSVAALGVDVDDLDRRLDPYRERFGVPREPVHP